ncbi:MAG: Hsp20/alpha crystallin family protein [Salinisphaera sp.]|nr:Hsp20/alpha crystallin family protein [Salinisphaera sp.]
MSQGKNTDDQQVATQGQSRNVATQRSERPLLPPADIYEEADAIRVVADMPGVSKDGLNIEVDGTELTISGDIRVDTPEGLTASYAEIRGSQYYRQFILGREIDKERISAEMDNGELTVVLPKKESHRPRQIEVKTA